MKIGSCCFVMRCSSSLRTIFFTGRHTTFVALEFSCAAKVASRSDLITHTLSTDSIKVAFSVCVTPGPKVIVKKNLVVKEHLK